MANLGTRNAEILRMGYHGDFGMLFAISGSREQDNTTLDTAQCRGT